MNFFIKCATSILAILTLTACSSDPDNPDETQNGYQQPELTYGVLVNDIRTLQSVTTPPFGGTSFEEICVTNYDYELGGEFAHNDGFETDNFIVVTPSDNPSGEFEMQLMATYAEMDLEDQLTELGLTASDLNIDSREDKVLLCSNKETSSGGKAVYEGVIYHSVDSPAVSSVGVTYNPHSSWRETFAHELYHVLEYRLATREPISHNFENPHRWFSEGIAEEAANRNHSSSQPTVSNLSSLLSSSSQNPLGNPLDEIYTGQDTNYVLFLGAVRYLTTPVESGGAGNTMEDVADLYDLMKDTAVAIREHYQAIPDTFFVECSTKECYEDRIFTVYGERKTIFEYAFDQTFRKDGVALSFQELRDNFYEGELWYRSL